MKQKFLEARSKNELRSIASNLNLKGMDKSNRDKLLLVLSTHPYNDLINAFNNQ